MMVERKQGAEVFALTRIDGPTNPAPHGYCEIWEGLFDSARRVEIMAEEIREEAPGTVHLVCELDGTDQVKGRFYVRTGRSLAGRTLYS